MKFNNENEKREFVKTMLQSGLNEARQQYLKDQKGFVIIEKGKTVELFGETLTAAEVRERYPEATVLELSKQDLDV